MWDLPRPGLEPVSPALAGRLSTTAPPGKPPPIVLRQNEQHTEENQPIVGTSRVEPIPVFRQPQIKGISHFANTENKLKLCNFHKWLILITYRMRSWPDFPSALIQMHRIYSQSICSYIFSYGLFFIAVSGFPLFPSSRVSVPPNFLFMDYDLPSYPKSKVYQNSQSNTVKKKIACPQVCSQTILEELQQNKDYRLVFTTSLAW